MKIELTKLYPNQSIRDLNINKIEDMKNNIKNGKYINVPIFIQEQDGFYFIIDGHHRVITNILSNNQFIDAIIVENKNIVINNSMYYDWEDLNGFRYSKYPK